MPIVIDQNNQNQQDPGTMDINPNQQPTNISGSQSSLIQTEGPTQQQSAKKQKGSGFTNVQQYAEANKGAAQQIAGAAQQGIRNQASSIGQQIQKQQQSFNQQVAANRERIQNAQQFGQQATQKASSSIDTDALKKQQDELNRRVELTRGASDQNYQKLIEDQQAAVQANQEKVQQAALERSRVQESVRAQQNQLDQFKQAPDLVSNSWKTETNYGKIQGIADTQAKIAGLQPGVENALNSETQAKDLLGSSEVDLEKFKYDSRLVERRNQLQGELKGLEEKAAANIPLTPEEVTRFRNILEEKEIFDNATYNDMGAERKADQLRARTDKLGNEQGRRSLLRETFSAVPTRDYTRGQSALDQLLLQTDQPVANEFISGSKQLGRTAQDQAVAARRQSLLDMAGLTVSAGELRKNLGEGIKTAQTGLESALDARQKTGEGSYLQRLQQSYNQGLLSEEQAAQLNLDKGNAYGVDIGANLAGYEKLANRESIGSMDDLAQARALAKLSGQQQQNIFNNENLVGQLNEAEKAKLEEVRQNIYDSKMGYAAKESGIKAARAQGMADPYGITGTSWGAGANTAGSERMVGAVNKAAEDGVTTQDELKEIMRIGSEVEGFGNMGVYANQSQLLTELQNEQLKKRLQVEGSQESLTMAQQQKALSEEARRASLLNAVQKAAQGYATGTTGGQKLLSLTEEQRKLVNADNMRTGSNNYNNSGYIKGNLIEAYNQLTGRNLLPEV